MRADNHGEGGILFNLPPENFVEVGRQIEI
jgi:hypothetical protein